MSKILSFAAILLILLSACNKNECFECSKEGEQTFEVCEDDDQFRDYQQFKEFVSNTRSAGWTCDKIK